MKLDHFAIAVQDLDAALKLVEEKLGGTSGIEGPYEVPEQNVRVFFATVDGVPLEYLEAISPKHPQIPMLKNPILSHVEQFGGGLHHIAFHVPSVRDAVGAFKLMGWSPTTKEPFVANNRLVIFMANPASRSVLIELMSDQE